MKCFSWKTSGLSAGLQVQADEKLGMIVFLGEEGRGRRYEKVGMSRRNPAEIVNGCVMNANPVKIALPAKDGKSEKLFYILERSKSATQDVLVRINSYGGYIRGGQGGWNAVAGKPEKLVCGYGAFGDAGRIGNWDDGLVVMHPGDVIRIHPSRTWGHGDSALWLDEAGQPQTASWQDYETIKAIHEATIADTNEKPQVFSLLAGQMPCFSFRGGEITPGFKLEKGTIGAAIHLGEKGRGRKFVEIPVIGEPPMVSCSNRNNSYSWNFKREPEGGDIKTCTCGSRYEILRSTDHIEIVHPRDKGEVLGALANAAVANLGNGIFGLVQSEKSEPNAYLVRICTGHGYTRRGDGSWELWRGSPTVVTKGYGADGDAGGIGSWDDGLFILREGDVVRVKPSGDGPAYAVFVKNSSVKAESWVLWKGKDAIHDPSFYVAKGTAPWGHVPAEWIGRVVTIMTASERCMSGGYMIPSYSEGETGELISIEPLVLNVGWEGRDRHDITVYSALWVVLTDKQVRRIEGEEAEKRKLIRSQAEELRNNAIATVKRSYFELTDDTLRNKVRELTRDQSFDTMPTEGWHNSLDSWVEKARGILEKFAAAEQELKTLEQRQNSGEIAVDFGGHFRVMGATGNAQYWVIKSDGSERDPDEVSYRKQYSSEGDKKWRLVGPEELAISWFKAYTAANHEFVVNKLPESGGCTSEQLTTVDRLECEISHQFSGSTGIAGTVSPEIDSGWDLHWDLRKKS